MNDRERLRGNPPPASAGFQVKSETFLFVDAPGALSLIADKHGTAAIVMTGYANLDGILLARVAPDRIVIPLFAPEFDAPQALEHLAELHYRGKVTVVAPRLPAPRMVLAELRASAPGMAVDLLSEP